MSSESRQNERITTKDRKVVVTGVGLMTPLGTGTRESWKALLEGRSGVAAVSRFDASRHSTRIAAEIRGFQPLDFIDRKDVRKMDLFIQYALAAAHAAVEDAGLPEGALANDRTGVLVGSGIGGIGTIEQWHKVLLERGPERITPFFLIATIINEAAGQISIRFGCRGPNGAPVTACAAGTHAIGEAFRLIARGDAEAMLAGGAEAPITPLGMAGFCSMKAMSERNDEPARASRPFDAGRDGFVIGEGAGILLLEELGTALRRGARIYAEVVGYGMSGDAFHPAAPAEDGDGAYRVMKLALQDAGLAPEDIQYINAHGTSTPLNDRIETAAVKRLFGAHAYRLGLNSTKSMTGHLLGAAGGVEAGITALCLKHQIMPPTINYETPDPDCDLDYVPSTARRAEIVHGLSNSFGFGGTNACLAFRRFEE
jgi:3-oxoacyl-[acyl-carrier-protein] synthase II